VQQHGAAALFSNLLSRQHTGCALICR
jgi:hypothetical protein